MQLHLVLFLAVASIAIQVQTHQLQEAPAEAVGNIVSRGINEKFARLLEKFKDVLKTGNETLGLPVLDPFKLDHQELPTISNPFNGTLILDRIKFSGLADYEIQEAGFKIVGLRSTINLQWAELKGKSAYDVNGVGFNIIDIYGTGEIEFNLKNLTLLTVIAIGENKGKLYIKSMDTEISLGGLETSITGLFDDEGLSDISGAIASDLGPTFIQNYQKKLTDRINTVVKAKANEILSTMSIKDLLKLIQE